MGFVGLWGYEEVSRSKQTLVLVLEQLLRLPVPQRCHSQIPKFRMGLLPSAGLLYPHEESIKTESNLL